MYLIFSLFSILSFAFVDHEMVPFDNKDMSRMERANRLIVRRPVSVVGAVLDHIQCMFCFVSMSPLMQCSRCKGAYYCSRECQKKHWKIVHKKVCQQLKDVTTSMSQGNLDA